MTKKRLRFLITFLLVMINLNVYVHAAKYVEPFELPLLTGDMREDFVNVAFSQLGYEEASDESTIFGAWADDPYQAWCSEFAAWCAEKAEIPTTIIPKKKSCAGYRKFFALENMYYYVEGGVSPDASDFTEEYKGISTISMKDAEIGDIILQESDGDYTNGPDHTAIFLENTADGVKTISGNSSDKVRIKVIGVNEIHGLCKPDFDRKRMVENINVDTIDIISSDWAESEVKDAYAKGLIPEKMIDDNLKKKINRAEFASVVVNMYSRITGKAVSIENNLFVDISESSYKDDIIRAYNLGVVKGISATEFNPLGEITREQAATMLMRTANVLGYDTSHNTSVESGVSSWATEGVGFVTENGIMNGTGNGFEPQGKYTKEQAIATFVRMYDNLK